MRRFPLLAKAIAIVLVFVLLNVILSLIRDLVSERHARSEAAIRSVEQSFAGPQTLLGPLLQRECSETWLAWEGEGKNRHRVEQRRDFTLSAAPRDLKVEGELTTEVRYRSLYKVNGYGGPLTLAAHWADLRVMQPQAEQEASRLACGPIRVWLAMTDVRGIRSAVARVDGEAVRVDPGTPHASHRRGLQLVLGAERSNAANRPLALSLNLDIIGTTQLALVPAAEETQWTLKADWPHPSFGGRFLPTTRSVTDQGFAAQWAVSTLASTAATDALEDGVICPSQAADSDSGAYAQTQAANGESHPCLDTLAVTLLDPVSPYVLSDRATKYGVMFIVLTFGFVALGEVLQRRRVHPIQYTLVGLALAIFFLLLLSLSEHIAFAWAYVIASAACVALLGFYGRFMLDSWRGGATMGAGVALLYAALWALLQLEQTALVIGAVLLFVALAAVMVLTRRIDWYAWFAALQVGSLARATAEQDVGGHAMHNVRGNPSPEGSS